MQIVLSLGRCNDQNTFYFIINNYQLYSDQKKERRKSDDKKHCISLLRVTKHFDHYVYRKRKNYKEIRPSFMSTNTRTPFLMTVAFEFSIIKNENIHRFAPNKK